MTRIRRSSLRRSLLRSSLLRAATVAVLAVVVAGCQAELDLSKVEAQQKEPIQRYDRFQAIAQNDNVLVVVGSDGAVIVSDDKGETWKRTVLPAPAQMLEVDVCPDQSFVALDFEGHLWKGDARGENWQAVEIQSPEIMMDVACDPKGRIWVVGAFSSILSSANGGQSWDDQSLGEDLIFTEFLMFPDGHGYVFGEFGRALETSDGGKTWTDLPPLPNEFYPMATYFRSPKEGWIGGLGGVILATSDGGKTWREQESEVGTPIYGIASHGGSVYAASTQGVLLKLTGDRWVTQSYPNRTYAYLRGLASLDSSTVLAVGGGGSVLRIKL